MKVSGIPKLGIGLFADDDPTMVSEKGIETFLGHFPAGTSYRCVNHFRQLMLSGDFRKYDFGIARCLFCRLRLNGPALLRLGPIFYEIY